jgi:signal transduction histidine kinase
MRGDRRLAPIPIMFLTAHDADRTLAMRGYASGAVDYLAKPYDPDELREKVRALLQVDEERRMQRDAVARATLREYQRLANALPAIVWTADEWGEIDFCSDRFTEQLHVDVDVLRRAGWEGIVHVDDLDRWLESRRRAVETGEPHTVECRLGSIADGYRLFHLRELPRTDEAGEVVGWVGSGLDIEDRRDALANKVLAEAGRVLEGSLDWRASLAMVPQLVVPSIADWCAVSIGGSWNLSWAASTPGIDPPPGFAQSGGSFLDTDSVLSTGIPKFVPILDDPSASDYQSALVVAIAEQGEIYGSLALLVAGSSRRFDLEDLELANRLAERLAATVRVGDLFDQARAGADASLVLDVVGDGVALVDRVGVVRVWNAAAERITGLSADALLGEHVEVGIPWWSEVEGDIPMAGDEPVAAATIPAGDADSDLWISISGVDFGRGRVYAFRDATAAHRLERLQSDFIATVSHELRTPLASITGASDTLHRDDIELSDATRARLSNLIWHQSRRLTALVDDVLMVGRLGGATVTAESVPVDAVAVAREVVETASLSLPASIDIALNSGDELPRVRGDRQLLEQVLTNLVENAVKYSPDGGHIDVTLDARVRTMRISVADEGIGIAASDLDVIFEKFFRVAPVATGPVSGTGLGLYIVRELVERMGGAIRVRSRLGHGTTFDVDLPLAESVLEARDGGSSTATSTGDEHVSRDPAP